MRYIVALLCLVLVGCSHPQPAYESKYTEPPPPVVSGVTVIGDSYANGLQELINIPARVNVAAVGGSGYVNRGYRDAVFGEQISAVKPEDRLVVVFGSRNDAPMPGGLAAAASSMYNQIRQAAPKARLMVIGPAWVDGPPPPEALQVRDTLRMEAEKVGAVFVDPIAEGWFVGLPQLISPDGVHPNSAGQRYLADMLNPLLAQQVTQG